MSHSTVTHAPVVTTFVQLAALRSPAHEEGPAAEFVRGYLDGLGIRWTEDDAATKIPAGCGNITATLAPTAAGTPIFLCAHLDTVALEDELEPVVLEDGRITNARDTILGGDNKAAVAVMLELMRELVESGAPHAGLEVIFTPCEEVGLLGAKHVDVTALNARFGYVFDHANDIGKVVGQAPSQISLTAKFTGVGSHSGIAPEAGRSAIRAAAEAITKLPLGRIDDSTTANIGIIEGGTAVNIVPEHCTLRGEVRSLDHDRVVAQSQVMIDILGDAAANHGVDLTIDAKDEYRAYSFSPNAPVVKHAHAALEAAGFTPELVACGGGSDGNIFNAMGKPCANLCNGMRMIHTADEYIMVEDLEAMLVVARELVNLAVSE